MDQREPAGTCGSEGVAHPRRARARTATRATRMAALPMRGFYSGVASLGTVGLPLAKGLDLGGGESDPVGPPPEGPVVDHDGEAADESAGQGKGTCALTSLDLVDLVDGPVGPCGGRCEEGLRSNSSLPASPAPPGGMPA